MKFLLPCLLVLLGTAAMGQTNLQQMLATEKAFAHMGDSLGIKAAFLEYLADSGMVFLPQPTLGKPAYQQLPESAAKLWWEPALGVMAAGGDMGFTTGPYIYKPDPLDSSSWRHGHFTSVWAKQASGQWKNVADFGTPHPAPEKPLAYPQSRNLVALPAGTPAGTKALLLQQDTAPPGAAVQASTALYRQGQPPLYQQATPFLAQENQQYSSWQPHYVSVAAGGDFGYSYGSYRTQGGIKGYYLRIWHWQGPDGWKLLLESLNRENP